MIGKLKVATVSYEPVPVEAAKQIAEHCAKSQVIILSWDPAFGMLHTTTYGVSAFDKESAAAAGEIAAKALGSDLSQKKTFEDFHQDYSPAKLREAEELNAELVATLREAGDKISALHCGKFAKSYIETELHRLNQHLIEVLKKSEGRS